MNLTSRYRTTSSVERKGFDDGYAAKARLFDLGFCRNYDVAYNAGRAVRVGTEQAAAGDLVEAPNFAADAAELGDDR